MRSTACCRFHYWLLLQICTSSIPNAIQPEQFRVSKTLFSCAGCCSLANQLTMCSTWIVVDMKARIILKILQQFVQPLHMERVILSSIPVFVVYSWAVATSFGANFLDFDRRFMLMFHDPRSTTILKNSFLSSPDDDNGRRRWWWITFRFISVESIIFKVKLNVSGDNCGRFTLPTMHICIDLTKSVSPHERMNIWIFDDGEAVKLITCSTCTIFLPSSQHFFGRLFLKWNFFPLETFPHDEITGWPLERWFWYRARCEKTFVTKNALSRGFTQFNERYNLVSSNKK